MTIALLTDGIPPFILGGMQKHSKLIAEYLAREEVDVLLYHCLPKDLSVGDSEVKEQFSKAARHHIHVRSFTYEDDGILPGHYLRSQRRLSKRYLDRLIEETENIDFIYAKGFTGWEVLNHRHYFEKISVGVNFHGMNMFQKQPDLKGEVIKYFLRPPVRQIMKKANYVFSYGGNISTIIETEIQDKEKVIAFPTGIEESWVRERVSDPQEPLAFLFVGRFDRLKGLPELYKAVANVTDSNRPFTIKIIGPIPEKNRLIDNRFFYTGPIYESKALMNEMDQADVLICPSISEGMPNVILEAMARGLAIFATNVGAIPVMVSQQNGILIAPGSTKAIIDGFNFFLNQDSKKLQQMKINSLSKVRSEFLWSDLAKSFKGILSERVIN